jgi:prepilin-type N-terminal cleavage/methylation domain-containing protein
MKRRGFTLIEVIIALVLFGVGILTLLRAIIYFVSSWDEVRAKAEATLLAKEAIDIVFNQRDTNIRRSVRWDCARIDTSDIANHPDACLFTFASWANLRVAFNGTSWYIISPMTADANDNKLFTSIVNGVTIFTYDNTQSPSPFTRTVSFTQAKLAGQNLATDNALLMTVTVWYMPSTPARTVVLETYLAAWNKKE